MSENKNSPSLLKSLIIGTVAGLFLGLLPLLVLYFQAAKVHNIFALQLMPFLIIPLMPIMWLANPILELEGEKIIVYVFASPVIWALAGLLAGYVIWRIRYALTHRAEYLTMTTPGEKHLNYLRIGLAVIVAAALGVAVFLNYNSVIKIKRDRKAFISGLTHQQRSKPQAGPESVAGQLGVPVAQETTANRSETEKEKDQLDAERRVDILVNLKWKRYSNPDQDVSFEYPADWNFSESKLGEGEFYLKVTKPGETGSEWMPDPLDARLLGTIQSLIPDHPNNIVGSCAYEYKNTDEFCEAGCTRIGENLAIDARNVNHGEPIFSAVGFSGASKNFPRLCLEMTLDELFRKVAEEKNISMEDLEKKVDFRDPQKDQQFSPEIFEALTVFRHMADSLSRAK